MDVSDGWTVYDCGSEHGQDMPLIMGDLCMQRQLATVTAERDMIMQGVVNTEIAHAKELSEMRAERDDGKKYNQLLLDRIDAAARLNLEMRRERDQLRADSENYRSKCAVCCTACSEMLGEDVCVACDRDRWITIAGLLEQCENRIHLPDGGRIWKSNEGNWWRLKYGSCTRPDKFATALAAIRAGMGWDEPKGES